MLGELIRLTPNILVSQYGKEAVLSRGGANETLQVELSFKPVTTVTLSFSSDTEEILPIDSVTFTPENWEETQNFSQKWGKIEGGSGNDPGEFDYRPRSCCQRICASEAMPSFVRRLIAPQADLQAYGEYTLVF